MYNGWKKTSNNGKNHKKNSNENKKRGFVERFFRGRGNHAEMRLFKSKGSQLINYLLVAIILFLFGFFSILSTTIFIEMIDAYNETGFYTGKVEETGNKFLEVFRFHDYVIVILLVALIIGVAITGFRLRTTPLGFIITAILGLFTGFVSFFFNYMFIQMVSEDIFNAVLVFFPRTLLICTNLHWVTLVALVVGSIALYGKKPTEFANE
jgi:hypothetical protein